MADHFIRDIKKRTGTILVFTGAASILALVLSLLMPPEYLSEASLLPSNSKLMDKQRLFGNNIQELYSSYGNAEDLDRLFATMQSSAVINHVADSLKLASHYDVEGRKNARSVAQKKLQRQIKLQRSEYGELRLRVWDKDPGTAAAIANALISKTQQVFDDMFRLYYDRSISNLAQELRAREELVKQDSTLALRAENAVIKSRISEYQVTRLNPPAAFFVMEKPERSSIPDRPVIWLNVLATFFVSLFTILAWIAARKTDVA